MKIAILFTLVSLACAGNGDGDVVVKALPNAASSPGFISGRSFYSGSNFVYPGSNFVYPGSQFVYPGSGIVPSTYSAVAPGGFAFRSAAFPSAVSYQTVPAAAIAYNAPIATSYQVPALTTYNAPIATSYQVPAVTYNAVAPKTIAQTKGSSHITY